MKSLARGTPVNGFIVRKERKTYGTGSSIEGALTDAPIVMVDDVLNSGSSLEKARVVLEQEEQDDRSRLRADRLREPGRQALAGEARHSRSLRLSASPNSAFRSKSRSRAPMAVVSKSMAFRLARSEFLPPRSEILSRHRRQARLLRQRLRHFLVPRMRATDRSAWKFTVNARGHKNLWSSPALHDGKVYFGSYDGNVYCLDAETGAEVWRFIGADWVGSSPALAPELGLLFIGLEFAVEGKRGSIAALRLENGEKVWEHMTKRYTHASPAYWPERQLVACGSNDNEMFLFDAPSGEMRWRFETTGEGGEKGSIRHAPAFDAKRGHLVTGCADGRIYIIDVETGKEVWSVRTDNTIYTVPLVVDDKAYIGSTDKYLYVLDLERRAVKTKIYAASKIFGPPRLLEGRIYFGACNGMVYEIDPATDEITGTHQLPDAITNALTYNSETGDFYALTYVNELFAFRRE